MAPENGFGWEDGIFEAVDDRFAAKLAAALDRRTRQVGDVEVQVQLRALVPHSVESSRGVELQAVDAQLDLDVPSGDLAPHLSGPAALRDILRAAQLTYVFHPNRSLRRQLSEFDRHVERDLMALVSDATEDVATIRDSLSDVQVRSRRAGVTAASVVGLLVFAIAALWRYSRAESVSVIDGLLPASIGLLAFEVRSRSMERALNSAYFASFAATRSQVSRGARQAETDRSSPAAGPDANLGLEVAAFVARDSRR